jgi:predicted Rossmann-fold nucleotide-binding protein
MTNTRTIQLNPVGWMSQLSQAEIELLAQHNESERYQLFRICCLAVLNSGIDQDDMHALLNAHQDFDVRLIRRERGVKIELINPPSHAFVEGKLIKGVHEHLFSVLRDLLYMENKYLLSSEECFAEGGVCTDMVFDMLRHANSLTANEQLNTVVCWGGHSIREHEYKYTKEVGYQLGLREFNICTGCGPGAMKGPMKGAAIGHAKQRVKSGRYIGITEPSIIAAEPPNAIVNELIIMPDIEKRLEAFVRFGHAIVIFPGGVGTAEELLYLLGIMLHDSNQQQHIPIVLTGPAQSAEYFKVIDDFIGQTLGVKAQALYTIIVDDAAAVGSYLYKQKAKVGAYRKAIGDSYGFNWALKIDSDFQHPFIPNHSTMAELSLSFEQPAHQLAANLRRAFSGIVAGNIKAQSVADIKAKGPYILKGDKRLAPLLDTLLKSFVEQGRMKLPGSEYTPCFQVTAP